MQALFEAYTEQTLQLEREVYRKRKLTNQLFEQLSFAYELFLLFILLVLAGLLLVSYIVAIIYEYTLDHLVFYYALAWAIFAFDFWILLYEPTRMAKHVMNENAKKFPGKRLISHSVFFDTYCVERSSKCATEYIVDYRDLLCVKQTKHYIILFKKLQGSVTIDKRGVTNGAADALFAFLSEKCEKH